MSGYTICFRFPDTISPLFACDHKGAMGWGGISAAMLWDTPEVAARFLANGYGSSKQWGDVVRIEDGEIVGRWEDGTHYPVLSNGWVNA